MSDIGVSEGSAPDEGALDWWCDGWWRQPNYLLPYPADEIERCVDIIKPFFTSQWLHEALTEDGEHSLARRLVDGQGYRMALFIVATGRIFDSLKNSEGFSRKLDELQGPKHASTYFELSLASGMSSWGARIRFPSEGRIKQPDIVCETDNGRFAVECKRLGEERWEKWEQALFMRLMQSEATRQVGEDVAQIELNNRLSELRLEDSFSDINEQLLVEFEKEIVFGLQQPSAPGTDGWVSLGGLGRVRLTKKAEGEHGTVTGVAVSPTAKLRRILSKGVLEAAEQLPKDLPSLIAVYSFFLPDPTLARIAFRAICKARPQFMSHIVGFVVFPGGTIFEHADPTLFLNQYSRFDAEASEPIQAIRSVYRPV